jgi:hypothetical protein
MANVAARRMPVSPFAAASSANAVVHAPIGTSVNTGCSGWPSQTP